MGTTFDYDGARYETVCSGKPSSNGGEPKTDVYIKARALDSKHDDIELKLSCKKDNARFLENKITAERAKEILGDDYADDIRKSCETLLPLLSEREKVTTEKKGRVEPGLTLGWRADILLGKSGKLSTPLNMTDEELLEVYSGGSLPKSKRDATVNGEVIPSSGVANQYYQSSDAPDSPQSVIDRLVPLDKYIKEKKPEVYLALKAVNYRIDKNKYEKRPLAVSVKYDADDNGMLRSHIDMSNPLQTSSIESFEAAKSLLNELDVGSSADLPRHIDGTTNKSDVNRGTMSSMKQGVRRKRGSSRKGDGKRASVLKIWVNPYVRANGTRVKGYWRRA